MNVKDKRGLLIADVRLSRTNRRTVVLERHGHAIGIPVDSLTLVADALCDLAESLGE